jgi:hypothetical protein
MSALLQQIESALTDLYSPSVPASRRTEIEAQLLSFKTETPNAWAAALEFLRGEHASLQLQFYAASIVDHYARPHVFDKLPPAEQSELLEQTLQTLQLKHPLLHPSAASKLTVGYVRLCLASTPAPPQVPPPLTKLFADLSSPTSPDHHVVSAAVLAALLVEYASLSLTSPLRGSRRRAATQALRAIVLPALPPVLASLVSPASPHEKSGLVQEHALRALGTVLSYPKEYKITRTMDITPLISLPLLQSLFSLASLPPPPTPPSPLAPLALEAVNEIIAANRWPAGAARDFALLICEQALSLVEAAAPAAAALPDEHLAQLTNFLVLFAERHLRAALEAPGFDAPAFLLRAATFCFALPGAAQLTASLAVWVKVAEFLEASEGAGAFLEQNERGLTGVLEAAVRAATFRHSGGRLAELDGGEVCFPALGEGGGAEEEEEPDGAGKEEADNGTVIDDAMDFALRESELGLLLSEVSVMTKLLSSLSKAATVAAFAAVSSLLNESLADLSAALADPAAGAGRAEKLCWDACVALRLLSTSLAAAAVFWGSEQ